MKVRALARRLAALDWHRFTCIALGVWALGLVIAMAQLEDWRRELTRSLLQLSADAQFRSRLAHNREAVDPEWYRRKALSLLAATETMRHDTFWTLFIPGSWEIFDDLEERVAARIERAFGDIVVETIRLELLARAGALAGFQRAPAAGPAPAPRDCSAPLPDLARRRPSAAAEDTPEYTAVRDYVQRVEALDRAVQAFLQLQQARDPDPKQLRLLVQYALNADVPGALQHSLPMFRGSEEVNVQPQLLLAEIQVATRCALYKGMNALHVRLLATNDLLALEQAWQERRRGLFDPAARPGPFDRTLERYRALAALLDNQHALLAHGHNDWMRQGTLQLGPDYEDMLARIGRMRLLGPEVLQQLQDRSGSAFAQFRRQFEALFGGRDDPGIVWIERERRFALSPQREALRSGLAALLREPFMAEDDGLPARLVRTSHALDARMPQLRTLAVARERFLDEKLALFPESARPAVERVVNARVAERVYRAAFRALRAAAPEDVFAPLDAPAYRRRGEQVAEVQELLADMGAKGLAQRLRAAHAGEVLRRLALLQEDARRLGLYDSRGGDFGWWQGDAAPLWQAFGVADAAALQRSLADQYARLESLGQRASPLLALADEQLARDPAVQRWAKLLAELDRYRARRADSSLLALEKFLQAGGPDLRRENCLERLAGPVAPHSDDDIGRRLELLHSALSARCSQLRTEAAKPSSPG